MTDDTMTEGDEETAEDAVADETADDEATDTPAEAGDAGDGAGGEATTDAVAVPEGEAEEPIKDRLILPLLIPWLSIAAVALLVLNISRVFLAGDSTSALVIAALLTVGILLGASALSAAPGARTSSLAMFLVLSLVILVSAGLVSLGPSLNDSEGAQRPPRRPAPRSRRSTSSPGRALRSTA